MAKSCASLVSVIIPVYNREQYLPETLESVLGQTHRAIQIVVVDDGSTDKSAIVAQRYADREPDRITLIKQANSGQVAARNTALGHARGEYIAFLDSDDLWVSDKLERQLPLFRECVGLVYSGIETIDENGRTIDAQPCDPRVRGNAWFELLQGNRMTGGSVVISREAFERVGMFDANLDAAENWDLWIRISKHFEVDYVDLPLVRYRRHGGNMSNDHGLMMRAIERILEKHCECADSPEMSDDLSNACRGAHASYRYRLGVHEFSNARYGNARRYFDEVLALQPGYRDARLRRFRCKLGVRGNRALSELAKTIKRFH